MGMRVASNIRRCGRNPLDAIGTVTARGNNRFPCSRLRGEKFGRLHPHRYGIHESTG